MVSTKNVRKNRSGGKKSVPAVDLKSGMASKSKLNFKSKPSQASTAAATIKAKSLLKTTNKRPAPFQPRLPPAPANAVVEATVSRPPTLDQPARTECCCCCPTNSKCTKEVVDESVIREPINSGRKGAKQIIDSVNCGTAEVRDLLFNECELILECRVCRQLFRSTANFLLHKRDFCLEHACEQMLLFDATQITYREEEEVVVVQEEVSEVNTDVKGSKMRTLQECLGKMAAEKEKQRLEKAPKLALALQKIANNPNAVYQERVSPGHDLDFDHSLHQEMELGNSSPACSSDMAAGTTTSDSPKSNSSDSADQHPHIKVTVKVAPCSKSSHNLSDSSKGSTKRVRKVKKFSDEAAAAAPEATSGLVRVAPSVSTSSTLSSLLAGPASGGHSGQVTCGECGAVFVSKKTLRVHIKTIHAVQRLLFPCPFCCMTFKQLCNASRHMITVHKKSRSDVKRLRDVVKLRARPLGDESPEDADEEERFDSDDEGDDGDDDELSNSPQQDTQLGHGDGVASVVELDEGQDVDMEVGEETSTLTSESTIRSRTRQVDKEVTLTSEQQQDVKENKNDLNVHACRACCRTFNRIQSKQSHERACPQLKALLNATNASNSEHVAVAQTLFAEQQNCNLKDMFPAIMMDDETRLELFKITNLTSLRCSLCPTTTFTSSSFLVNHAVTHLGHQVLKCRGCLYQSLSRSDLHTHLSTVHNIRDIEEQRSRLIVNLSATSNCSSSHTESKPPPPPPQATVLTPPRDEDGDGSIEGDEEDGGGDSTPGDDPDDRKDDESLFRPPPLYDSRLSPLSTCTITSPTSPTTSPSSSITNCSSESNVAGSGSGSGSSDNARIKLVFQRKPQLTSSSHSHSHSHSKKARQGDIYAVTKVEECPLPLSRDQSPVPDSFS